MGQEDVLRTALFGTCLSSLAQSLLCRGFASQRLNRKNECNVPTNAHVFEVFVESRHRICDLVSVCSRIAKKDR